MNTNIFIVSIILLQGICWWVGKKFSKESEDPTNYYLAGRGVSFFPLMMTFLATQVGGGIVLGSAEEAYRIGWWVLFYPLGQILGLLGLGCGIGKRLARFKVSTVAQIFEVVYGSPLLKKAASLFSILSLFMILIAQVLASKFFLKSLSLDMPWLFFIFWGILIAYTAIGGMKGVIAVDMIQAGFFIFVFFGAFIVALISSPSLVKNSFVVNDFSLENLSGWLFMPMLFTFIEQDMGQRCFAARSSSILSKATIYASLGTLLICAIPIYFGILGQTLGVEKIPGASILMISVSAATSPVIAALVACAVIAAILSTANALINAIGSNLSQDFFFHRNSTRKTKWLSIAVGAIAVFASSWFDNVVSVLIQSYELSVSCLLVPLMAGLFLRGKRFLSSAVVAIVFGAMGFLWFRLFPPIFLKEILEVIISAVGFSISEGFIFLRNRTVNSKIKQFEGSDMG